MQAADSSGGIVAPGLLPRWRFWAGPGWAAPPAWVYGFPSTWITNFEESLEADDLDDEEEREQFRSRLD
jgi:hypothetical protein